MMRAQGRGKHDIGLPEPIEELFAVLKHVCGDFARDDIVVEFTYERSGCDWHCADLALWER